MLHSSIYDQQPLRIEIRAEKPITFKELVLEPIQKYPLPPKHLKGHTRRSQK
jgi:hypothetical protein